MSALGDIMPVVDSLHVIDQNGNPPTELSPADAARIDSITAAISTGKVMNLKSSGDIDWLEANNLQLRLAMDGKPARNMNAATVWEALKYAEAEVKRMTKRELTLADLAVAGKSSKFISERTQRDIRRAISEAQKFVLTPEASKRVGEAMATFPEYLVTNSQFAIPPHEVCWIEYDCRALQEAAVPGSMTPMADDRAGYLFFKGHVYTVSSKDGESQISPLYYTLNEEMTPQRKKEIIEILGITRDELPALSWGHSMAKRLSARFRSGLIRKHSVGHMLVPEHRDILKGQANHLNSEIRNIIGLLLMINQPSKTIYLNGVARERKVTAKGMKMFMAHNVVTIAFDAAPKLLLRASKKARDAWKVRWHEVRGHFVRDRTAKEAKCDHGGGESWVQLEPRRWECSQCGGKRSWREYKNGRGDSSIGVSLHHHVIET